MTITGDHSLTKVVFWCIPTVLAPGAFVGMKIERGKTRNWKYQYRFFTIQ